MNLQDIHLLLRLAGLVLCGLVLANFVAAKRFQYAENLRSTDVIIRQIFHVHSAYIIAIIGGLAVLCLGSPELLTEGKFSRVFCIFFALFWSSRVLVQLKYYDRDLRRSNRFWDVFFLCVFGFLGVVFTLTALLP
ncbi:MAG: hypothetical protein AB8D78_06640 [Akkermansiaceae bacterium]